MIRALAAVAFGCLCTGTSIIVVPQPPLPTLGRYSIYPWSVPIHTTVCDLIANPARYNGQLIAIHGRVLVDFEEFQLDTRACKIPDLEGIWLEYGSGPKRQPTTWCCGDLRSRDKIRVLRNQEFAKFDRALRVQPGSVTALLTGRFGVAPAGRGYGHFGVFPARLVIRSVSDVNE